MTELHYLPAVDLAARIRDREIGCLELLDHFLERCDRHNPTLNAVIAWDREGARARAREADEALAGGNLWGPLHGVPMTIKESYDVAGMPTTWGWPNMRNNVAEKNSVVVDRMLAAGVVLFGKTNVPLFLSDWESFNEIYGTTNNPWDIERSPGGSSGGSAAALAAGLTGIESGSDIGASIRNPAHYCGVFGHKPTWGIVPPRGQALPGVLSQTDISVVGPMARSAEDLAVALDCMAGPDALEADGIDLDLPQPAQTDLSEFRVAVMQSDDVCPVDAPYADRIQEVADKLAELGAVVDDKARPDIDMARSHEIYVQLLRGATAARMPDGEFSENLRLAGKLDASDDSYRARAFRAMTQYHRDWAGANEERTHMRWAWHRFFQDWDVLLCPAASSAAFPHMQKGERWDRFITVNGEPQSVVDQLFWAGLTCVVYLPATVAPIGRVGPGTGLPVGAQIAGPSMHDHRTIAFAGLLAREIGGFEPPPGWD